MRNVFDWLAKRMLERAFQDAASVRASAELAAETQLVDVWIQPAMNSAVQRAPLGLLGRIVDRTSLLEAFHEAPSVTLVRDCVLKLLVYDARERREERAGRSEASDAMLWILSAGHPRTAIAELGFVANPGWPAGVYSLPSGWNTSIVVVSALERTRDTLLLRLLGAESVLEEALAELVQLPRDAVEVKIALPVLRELRLAFASEPGQTEEERRLAMQVEKTYEQIISEEHAKARLDGEARVLLWQLEARLGRELTEAERRIVHTRLSATGTREVALAVLKLDTDGLLRWLSDSQGS